MTKTGRLRAVAGRWIGGMVVPVALAVTAAGASPGQAGGEGRGHASDGLEDRVKLLAKALDLDLKQELELRKILQRQRAQVREVWSDPSVAPAYRVAATQVIGERTAELIRALLNDRQRKKFSPPRLAHEAAGSSLSVEEWMDKAGRTNRDGSGGGAGHD